jgi:hypothetical protein
VLAGDSGDALILNTKGRARARGVVALLAYQRNQAPQQCAHRCAMCATLGRPAFRTGVVRARCAQRFDDKTVLHVMMLLRLHP